MVIQLAIENCITPTMKGGCLFNERFAFLCRCYRKGVLYNQIIFPYGNESYHFGDSLWADATIVLAEVV